MQTWTLNDTSTNAITTHSGMAAGAHQQFGAILYDFTKAYDRVPKQILVKKMISLDVPTYLIHIVYDWITNRTFTVSYRGHETQPRQQENGIPQRYSLSVLLWLIFVYDIPLTRIFQIPM